MKYATLGESGLRVSCLAFGGAPLMSRADRRQSWNALQIAVDGGVNFFDTAPSYGQGDSERIIGECLASQRDKFLICTKVGQTISQRGLARTALGYKDYARPLVKRFKVMKRAAAAFLQSRTTVNDFAPLAIRNSVESSLKRLQTDYIDILLMHEPSIDILQKNETFEPLEQLVHEGKVRAFGVSCNTAEEAMVAISNAPTLSVIQIPLSIFDDKSKSNILELAKNRNVGVIARGALVKGKALAAQPNEFPAITILRAELDLIAKQQGMTLGQVLLHYSLRQESVSSVLVSMIDPGHIEENIAAFDFKSDDIVAKLLGDRISNPPSESMTHLPLHEPKDTR